MNSSKSQVLQSPTLKSRIRMPIATTTTTTSTRNEAQRSKGTASGNDSIRLESQGKSESHKKADKSSIIQQTAESTERMVKLIEETGNVSGIMSANLHSQGAQLNSTERTLDKITTDLSQTEQTIEQIERVEKTKGIWLFCPCFHPPEGQDTGKVVRPGPSSLRQRQLLRTESTKTKSKPFWKSKGTNASSSKNERIINENLEKVSRSLVSLKDQAEQLGGQLDQQNQQLDRMNKKTGKNIESLHGQTSRINKLL